VSYNVRVCVCRNNSMSVVYVVRGHLHCDAVTLSLCSVPLSSDVIDALVIIIIIIIPRTIFIVLYTVQSHMLEFTLGPLSESQSSQVANNS